MTTHSFAMGIKIQAIKPSPINQLGWLVDDGYRRLVLSNYLFIRQQDGYVLHICGPKAVKVNW